MNQPNALRPIHTYDATQLNCRRQPTLYLLLSKQ